MNDQRPRQDIYDLTDREEWWDEDPDQLRALKGIAIGIGMSALLWVPIIAVAFWLWR